MSSNNNHNHNHNHNHRITVEPDGSLHIPAEIARKYGFTPGAEVRMDEKESSLALHRPVTRLAKLYIEPTSLCNLTCRTCIRNAWDEPMGRMSMATFERVMADVQQLQPRPSIFFGGFGEPLSHPRIIDMVRRAGEVSEQVELITNGVMLNERRTTALIEAGLSRLWVSVDGATPESYADIRLGAALPRIFKNILRYRSRHQKLKGCDPDLGVVFVAMQRNIADLPELLRMSSRLGVSRYLVTNVLPYTLEMCDERLYTHFADTLTRTASPWSPHLDIAPLDANLYSLEQVRTLNTHQHNFFLGNNLAERRNACPFIGQGSVAVAWDGSLSPCLPLMHSHDSYLINFKRVVQRQSVGNVNEQGLLALWESPDYVAFRRRVDEFDFAPCTVCAGCEMAESNQEDCFGNPFPTCGGCLWAQGFIRCP